MARPDLSSLSSLFSRDTLRFVLRRVRERLWVKPLFIGIEPFATSAGARIIELAEAITGARAVAVPFGTEAPLFQSMGKPTIVLGPGDIALAHQPNESIARADLHRAVDELGRSVRAAADEVTALLGGGKSLARTR